VKGRRKEGGDGGVGERESRRTRGEEKKGDWGLNGGKEKGRKVERKGR